jgi:hypothetical protein
MPLLVNHETSGHAHSPIWSVSLAAAKCSGAAGKVEPHWQPHLLQKPPDALANGGKNPDSSRIRNAIGES